MDAARDSSNGSEPLYRDPAIYYSFVFDGGVTQPAVLAALKLLDSDLGVSSALPAREDVLLASRYRTLESLRQLMEELAEVERDLRRQPMVSFVRWAVQHPILLARHLRKTTPDEAPTDDGSPLKSVEDQRRELEEFLTERMTRAQFLQVIARHNDEKLYRPTYLAEDPFVRVDLQTPTVRFRDGQELGIDTILFVHRTGICVLTYYCQFTEPVTHEDVVKWSISSQLEISEATVPSCLHEENARKAGFHPSDIPGERSFHDVEWITQKDLDWSLVDLFNLYSGFLSHRLQQNVSTEMQRDEYVGWLSYPTIILRSATPSLQQALASSHEPNVHLDELLLRTQETKRFRESLLLETEASDVSVVDDYSFYVQSSHSLLVYDDDWWEGLPRQNGELPPGNHWIPRDFSILAPIEHLLVEKWILEVAQSRLDTYARGRIDPARVRSSVGFVLDELSGVAPVQFGSLQELFDRGREIFGIDRQLQVLDDQLRWVEGALAATEAEVRDRRGRRLAQLSIVVSLVLGLPAVHQVVEFLQGWREIERDAYWGLERGINLLTDLARSRPVLLTLSCYIILIVVVCLLLVGRRIRQKPIRVPAAYSWSGPIVTVEEGEGEERKNDLDDESVVNPN